MPTSLEQLQKADALMNDDLMRADPTTLAMDALGGGYVILKAFEKAVKARLKAFHDVLVEKVPRGQKVETDLFYINHILVQRKPVLSFPKVRALQQKHNLPEDAVFVLPDVPPLEQREVDLDYLRQRVSQQELDACYESTGESTQLRQGARGQLKRRLVEVVK